MRSATHTPVKASPPPVAGITPAPTGFLQRACACGQHSGGAGECRECRRQRATPLQRAAITPGPPGGVPPIVHEVLRAPGQSLDATTRAFMEPRFGHDFSGVRVHTDSQAAGPVRAWDGLRPIYSENGRTTMPVQCKPAAGGGEPVRPAAIPASSGSPIGDDVRSQMEERFHTDFSAVRIHTDQGASQASLELGARAFTHGQDIYFASAHYQPTSRVGLSLLAHELTHVVQQRNGRLPHTALAGQGAQIHGRLEAEAEHVERAFQTSTAPLQVRGRSSGAAVQRSPGLLDEARALAAGGIEGLADAIMTRFGGAGDAVLAQLNALRAELSAVQQVVLPAAVVTELEAIYSRFRALAPSWVPIPTINFTGMPVQRAAVVVVGGVAIGVGTLLLLLAILIVLIWLMGNLIPEVRRQRERDVERVVESIREALQPRPAPPPARPPTAEPESAPAPPPPRPGPAPAPTTEPGPAPRPPPIPYVPRLPDGTEPRRHPDQTCDNAVLDRLQAEKDRICNSIPGDSCSPSKVSPKRLARRPCSEIRQRIQAIRDCLQIRQRIQDECFGGRPDPTHQRAMDELNSGLTHCLALEAQNCAPGHPMANL